MRRTAELIEEAKEARAADSMPKKKSVPMPCLRTATLQQQSERYQRLADHSASSPERVAILVDGLSMILLGRLLKQYSREIPNSFDRHLSELYGREMLTCSRNSLIALTERSKR